MKKTTAWLIVLILLTALGWSLKAALGWFESLNTSIAAAWVTAFLTLLGVLYAQWQSKSRDIAESHRETKIAVYNAFFDIIEKFQNQERLSPNEENNNPTDETRKQFAQLNRGLVLWASPEVIKAWLNFRAVTDSGGNVLVAVDGMYRAIRKDLGHSNFKLGTGDLIKLSLSDPDELQL